MTFTSRRFVLITLTMNNKTLIQLVDKCKQLRLQNLDLCYKFGGHLSTCFSSIEILVSIYYSELFKFSPKDHINSDRDTFILSKGHGCEIVYLILQDKGYFSKKFLLNNYRRGNFNFAGHIDSKVKGVEFSSGSLGHGLGFGAGVAKSYKQNNYKKKVIVFMGDAETTAGSVWEAANFASFQKLDNLIVYVDFNKIGATEWIKNFVDIKLIRDKWKKFGWNVIEVMDGNSIFELHKIQKILFKSKKPTAILCHTTKGKGSKITENDPIWHTKNVDDSNYEKVKEDIINGF
jgi:transketolase